MQYTLLLLTALSGLAASASIDWPAPVRDYYSAVGRRVAAVKKGEKDSTPPDCNVALAVPPVAPTPLPSPSPNLTVYHVAIGRGTQVSLLVHFRFGNPDVLTLHRTTPALPTRPLTCPSQTALWQLFSTLLALQHYTLISWPHCLLPLSRTQSRPARALWRLPTSSFPATITSQIPPPPPLIS